MEKRKVRILVELDLEDYWRIAKLKSLTGLLWKDIVFGGMVFWINKLNLRERVKELQEGVEEIEKEGKILEVLKS
jgi:hypothetical protein